MARVTTVTFKKRKEAGEKIAVLTAYDFPTARLLDEAGVEALLVGDSLGNVIMGLPNTLGVTMDIMLHHTRMVSRAAQNALVIADMPFLSYQINPEEALRNAGRFIAEAGAHAVKLEGPASKFGGAITAILNSGIPVMGHIGLTPQSINQIGGYKIQGKDPDSRRRLMEEAKGLEALGCFAIVLECMNADLAEEITQALTIPTIGIGAGAGCDGQVLVLHDILGWGTTRFCKTFVDVRSQIKTAAETYVAEVKAKTFPTKEQAYK